MPISRSIADADPRGCMCLLFISEDQLFSIIPLWRALELHRYKIVKLVIIRLENIPESKKLVIYDH